MAVEDIYKIFYQQTPVMMQAIEKDGTLQAVSRYWLEKLGYAEDEVIGRKVFDFLSESTNKELLSGLLDLVLNEGRCRNVKIECIKKNGDTLEAYATAELVKDNNGNLTTISWALYDVDDIDDITPHHDHFFHLRQIKNQLLEEREYLRSELSQIKEQYPLISQSDVMRSTFEKMSMVAKTDANVLILGESGVGKELVAHTIVKESLRHDCPSVTLNCASITKDLFESTLFGHIKGAFTGAIADRKGLWGLADSGTLFLDEVGEIPIDLQAKLLRSLQNKEYQRVGEDTLQKSNVRIIAATNRDLKKMVREGQFREDLYYRLNVFPIEIPPLRERKEDIPLLTRHFLDKSCDAFQKKCYGLNETTLNLLKAYDWPGNVRELQNVIERSVILSSGSTLQVDSQFLDITPAPKETLHSIIQPINNEFHTADELKNIERESIIAALNKANWKISGKNSASEYLGIHPSTLNSKILSLEIKKN